MKPGAGPTRKTRLRTDSKHWKKALDNLCRQVVFARDGYKCIFCGSARNPQWCHVDSRRYLSTRWRLENSMLLCAGCHLLWHHKPYQSVTMWSERYPDRAQTLAMLKTSKQKFDRKLERLYLEAEAAKLGLEP